jgi:S1-C subfamily serine protease
MIVLALLALLPGQVPTLESKDFARETQQAALTATVRITDVSAGTDGSGVLLRHDGAVAYILTANHVVGKAGQLHVSVFSAASYPKEDRVYRGVEVLARDARADLAVIRVVTRDKLPAPLSVCPIKQTPSGKDFAVLTVGCELNGPPVPIADVVQAAPAIRKPGEASTVKCWETAKGQVAGRSGGPLLDRQGRVIGVASGTSGGKGYYIHTEEIHAFLKRKGLGQLVGDAR